ncbi:MAG: hypothetical protein RMM58_09095 [Chloroflexota bacterium]|nr:hypothetical protein [Dehalococcoidia bacterium]MDW8254022.1 hypothetical protein [Chloroflexota bacterium]
MAAAERTELTIPGQPSSLPLARAYVEHLFRGAGCSAADAQQAGEVGAAALTLVLDRLDPAAPGSIKLSSEVTATTIRLTISDLGLPFDPEQNVTLTPPRFRPLEENPERRHASRLIRQFFDEARWVNLGPRGMELRLSKRLPTADITQRLPAAALTPWSEDVVAAPPQEYAIRRMRPDEAIGVAQCIFRTYGYTYPNEDLYYPDRIVEQNERGELVSVVAVTMSGELVGHYALERPGLGPLAESGQAVVVPAHRGRNLMERMRAFLVEEAKRLGLAGIYSQPVTNHPFSQRVNERFGAKVCGISLGLAPASMQFKAIDETLEQRVSTMLYFTPLRPLSGEERYAPPRHAAMLQRIYAQFGVAPRFARGAALFGFGQVDVSFDRGLRRGRISVHAIGADTPAEIRQAQRVLVETGSAEVIYLELPLSHPSTPALCDYAERAGFFFSGLGPYFAKDGDVLRLQYLAVPLDPARLEIVSDFGKELRDYIVEDWTRVRALASS